MSDRRREVGIVAALRIEAGWLHRVGRDLLIDVGGIGRSRARASAQRLLDRGARALVSWGVAGGLEPELRPGDVILADSVMGPDGSTFSPDREWIARLERLVVDRVPSTIGSVAHSDEIVTSSAQKDKIRKTRHGTVVDMETLGVAEIAVDAGAPWIAVRVVLDTAEVDLPPAIVSASGADGRLKAGRVARLVLSPWCWPSVFRIARSSAAAARSMREVAAVAGPDLGFGGDVRA